MKIGITNDHRGIDKKNKIVKFLKKRGYEVVDYGSNTNQSDDYPNFAFQIGSELVNNNIDFAILLCRTGIGMSIAANKIDGVRCANPSYVEDAKLSRIDNNANAISLKSSFSMFKTKKILIAFLETKFTNEERHIRRINMIDNYLSNKGK